MAHKHDASLDYLRYPTFAPLPRPVARCKGCGGSAFEFLLPQWKPVCKRCGRELELAGKIVRTEPPGNQPAPSPGRIQICASSVHTVLLRPDGTVRAAMVPGNSKYDHGQCNVQDWTDIIAVACDFAYTIGLRKDGTVLVCGTKWAVESGVHRWSGITAIAAGDLHILGLRKDGTVNAIGQDLYGRLEVKSWSNIISVAAGSGFSVGLRADGSVLAVGNNSQKQCNTRTWSGIKAIAAGSNCTIGLRKDGTVCAVGAFRDTHNFQNWSGIIEIAGETWHTVGLQNNGKVLSVGSNPFGQCNTGNWSNVIHIWAAEHFTAAQTADGTILCTNPEIQKWLREAMA